MVVNETCQMISALWSQYKPLVIVTLGIILILIIAFIISGIGLYLFVNTLKKNPKRVLQDLSTLLLGVAGGLVVLYADKAMSNPSPWNYVFFFAFTLLIAGVFIRVSSWFWLSKRKNKQ